MHRTGLEFLDKWLSSSRRKPLVIRGARQVGKTWVVRHLAQSKGLQLVEFNFEKKPGHAGLFEPNDPKTLIATLNLS